MNALLNRRRSSRRFTSRALALQDLSAIAWAAQGVTDGGKRIVPSAHALYGLTLTAIIGSVDGDTLPAGIYTYKPETHTLVAVVDGDHREAVARTTLADREWLGRAPVIFLLSGDLGAANHHFKEQPPRGLRGQRYLWIEAGHVSQNVYLAATEAGLGAVLVAGFDDDQLLGLTPAVVPAGNHPLALLALGYPDSNFA